MYCSLCVFFFSIRRRQTSGALVTGVQTCALPICSVALITARLASEAGRDVFAVPSSIHNPMARGCHRLIREGAGLVEAAGEVIAAVAPLAAELGDALRSRLDAPSSGAGTPVAGPSGAAIMEDPDSHRVWPALGPDHTRMDRPVE